ncbi:hypothetical protein HanRHA438_Chr13g0596601 [Helianthus annuus]|nr:hypothetical protein HanRHA438_Chr13g0596601 [Helianthus annuus]
MLLLIMILKTLEENGDEAVAILVKRNIKDLQEADLKKTIIPAKSQSEEEEQQTQLLVLTEEPIKNIFPHVKEYLDLLEDVCNKDDHFLGSPCDDNFWPKFAWELSQRRRVLISSPLCESFCSRMCAFYRSAKNPVSDMQKIDKWKRGKHLEILEKIFGEHGYKFAFVPKTPPSSSSIKRAYHVGGAFRFLRGKIVISLIVFIN